MALIEARDLVKEFSRQKEASGRLATLRTFFSRQRDIVRAVDGVSFSIEAGEIVGYLGPNGAGKSTTIKMLTGILVPTEGEIDVAGLVPWKHRQANAMNIGAVFGQRTQLWWALPLEDSLQLIGRMYNMSERLYREKLAVLTELLDLGPFLRTPVRQLSLGQRMRGDIAAAVIYEPPILFLDEPTVGLDIVAKERIRHFIQQVNDELGTTVLLTTHDMDDIERLCRRIIIIDKGNVLFDGETAALKRRYSPSRIIDLRVPTEQVETLLALVDSPPKGVISAVGNGNSAFFEVSPRILSLSGVISELAVRIPIVDLSVREQKLEAVIRQIYEASSRGTGHESM